MQHVLKDEHIFQEVLCKIRMCWISPSRKPTKKKNSTNHHLENQQKKKKKKSMKEKQCRFFPTTYMYIINEFNKPFINEMYMITKKTWNAHSVCKRVLLTIVYN